jgi:hypothetical protein
MMGFLLIALGGVGIIGGTFGKDFHAVDVDALGEFKQKIPTWLGRVVSIVVGIGLIGIGIKMLLGD